MRYKFGELIENVKTTDEIGTIAIEEIYSVACEIFETLEFKGIIFGNGHVIAQKYALLSKLIIMQRSLLKDADKEKFEEIKKEVVDFLDWII